MPSHQAIQAANDRLARLMSMINASKLSFSKERSLHKEIWNSEVTNDEWRAALYQAHGLAMDALKEYVTALETEALQMRAVLAAYGPLRLLPAQLGNAEAMKGDICVQVQQRWAYEEMAQRLSGMSGR